MILIIDDNKDLADIFCEYLNMAGYEAAAVYSGEEGIAEAKKLKPQVVFQGLVSNILKTMQIYLDR